MFSLELIITRLNAQAANIFLIEEKKQVFQCIASKYQSYLEDFEIPITQGVMGRAVLNKKCLSIPDFKYETIKFVIDKEFNNLIYKK